MKRKLLVPLCIGMLYLQSPFAQIDSSLLRKPEIDSLKPNMNMDAVYNRPFILIDRLPVSIGGYVEVNWQHVSANGISKGHQFQMRRMTLFVASAIGDRIKFLSEIEPVKH